MLKTIVTHSGTFHADEALAIAMLRRLPAYQHHQIVRTRDPALIATGDIVVDVGGEYQPQKNWFDHHQRSFTENYSKKPQHSKIKLSSAGLVYKHFGQQVIETIVPTRPLML